MARIMQMSLDQRGFDRMVEALAPENRAKVARKALRAGANIIQNKVRSNYKRIKPDSDLDKAIVLYEFPSGEGAIVRRFFKKAMSRRDDTTSPFRRAYILNYIENGAQNRKTKGKGKVRRGPNWAGLNRGSIPAYRFFRKGYNGSKNKAFKEIERVLLVELAKQARK